MVPENRIKQYLEELEKKHPLQVVGKLENGSRVMKSLGLTYNIDDINIDRRLGNFPKGIVPYGPIHRGLRTSPEGIRALFNGSSEIPFSKTYEAGIGECLEKAVLVQLAAQRGESAFLINGNLVEDTDGTACPHAFNVVFTGRKPVLIDAENPLAKDSDGKITHPYTAPIIGIDEDCSEFLVPDEWKQGRNYSVF